MGSVLFVRHHLEDNPGLIGEAFRARGYDCDLVMMDESTPTPSLDGYDVLVILGSKESVYDDEVEAAWFGRELALMGDAVDAKVPILGICFGAQALCRFHGGRVELSDTPEIGWYEVEAHNDAKIEAGPWFEFHYDRCVLPPVAQLWATSPGTVQAFCVGQNVGVQFHPEVDERQLRDWFEADLVDHPREFASREELLLQTARETPAARERARGLVDVFLAHIAS
ncbi:MAG: type 1 glutamine amidotransferase [Acidimicrobiales bacterium]|jgi:GMP synthase-like glutamine amidotransferase